MCSPPCMGQATSHTPFDFTVDTTLKTARKCDNTSVLIQKKQHNLTQKGPFFGGGDDPLHTKEKMQVKRGVSKRNVLALYEDYLKKRIKETWPKSRMGNRFFEEIKARGYQGSFKTVKTYLCRVRKECEFPKEISLPYYKGYIKKRLEEVQPSCVSAKKLFHEITAQGYRGSFSAVERFLCIIRKETKMPKEASIQFYKEYLIKRVKEAYPQYVSETELLGEIKAKGYQGTLKTVQSFLVPIYKSIAPQASLNFHKNYLIKRLKDALPDCVSGKKLLEEIKAQGYRGSFSTLQTFLSMFRKKRPKEVSLGFHKGYLTKRVKDVSPDFVSTGQLFEEIRAQGYRGSFATLRAFLSVLRKREKKPSEELSNTSVEFYKNYLTKRLEETYPNYVSGIQLFKEIQAKGYRGSISTFRMFLSTLRKQEERPNKACVEFHEEYLSKRLKETCAHFVPIRQLLEEIKAKGYRGSFSTLQGFLSVLREQQERPSEAYLEFHRDYLIKRLEETYPKYASGKELFKEIQAKGYQGTFPRLQQILSTLRKQTGRPSEACVRFHKEYLSKRIKDALPNFIPAKKLFEEITDRGYQGAFNTLQGFLSTLRKQEESQNNDLPKQLDKSPLVRRNILPEASLQFHKDYLIKTLQETWPSCLPPEQLFEEIVSRGYRGTCKEVEVFLMMVSK